MTPGPRGYPDYQRVENWDGPEALTNFGVLNTGKVESAIVECSRYGYLTGCVGVGVNQVVLNVEYFYDEAGANFIGIRQLILDPQTLNTGQVNLPNLGPFIKVIVKPTSETTKWEGFIRLFLSNRLSPTELRLPVPLLAEGTQAFGSAGSVIVPLAGYFSGPARALVYAGGASTAFLDIEAATFIGTWVLVDRTVATSGTLVVSTAVLPSTAVRINVQSSGANTVKYALTPFTSGSS
jgi:hypothetical protein